MADDAIVITNPQQYMAEAMLCPLTLCTIEDPVIAMDGVTYEREGILSYFRHERSQGRVPRSPVSRQSLASEMLLPNRALKAIIQAHKAMDSNAALPPRPTRSNSQPVPSMSSPPVSRQPSARPSVSRQPSAILVRRGDSATRPLDGHWPWLQWTPPGTEGEGGSRSGNDLPVSRSSMSSASHQEQPSRAAIAAATLDLPLPR